LSGALQQFKKEMSFNTPRFFGFVAAGTGSGLSNPCFSSPPAIGATNLSFLDRLLLAMLPLLLFALILPVDPD